MKKMVAVWFLKTSKFLEWADIDGIIREGYSKRWKRLKESKSKSVYTWKEFNSIHIEVDMWRTIWTNAKYNMNYPYSKLTIIVDYDWNIVSAYPMSEFKIKRP